MTPSPALAPDAPPSRSHAVLLWFGMALAYAVMMTAATLWGLKTGERGIDTRSQGLLACYALGSPLGLLALAPLYRLLLPRRWPVLRYPLALVYVAGASAAAISFLAFAATTPYAELLGHGLSPLALLHAVIEPYALEGFLFLSIGYQVAMPQALVPLVLAAWWLGARRARV